MNILLIIISIVILLAILYKIWKSSKLELLHMRLSSVYDRIELEIVKSKPHLSSKDIKFLLVNKNIAVNPQYLDLDIMIAIHQMMEKKNIKSDILWYNEYVESLPVELKELLESFTKIQIDITIFSALRVKFICKALTRYVQEFFNSKRLNLNEFLNNKISETLYTQKDLQSLNMC